ncbi:hypothetical protein KI387_035570 [Taxus chinensis]|uniref:Uncharacterized protein n=1 Tax=Taxus chinensis TaxID=29808 RepID=A0AA38FNQ5_TAXCH|nr:hypothetical protein KI387_035570 [Taxus chinensis]
MRVGDCASLIRELEEENDENEEDEVVYYCYPDEGEDISNYHGGGEDLGECHEEDYDQLAEEGKVIVVELSLPKEIKEEAVETVVQKHHITEEEEIEDALLASLIDECGGEDTLIEGDEAEEFTIVENERQDVFLTSLATHEEEVLVEKYYLKGKLPCEKLKTTMRGKEGEEQEVKMNDVFLQGTIGEVQNVIDVETAHIKIGEEESEQLMLLSAHQNDGQDDVAAINAEGDERFGEEVFQGEVDGLFEIILKIEAVEDDAVAEKVLKFDMMIMVAEEDDRKTTLKIVFDAINERLNAKRYVEPFYKPDKEEKVKYVLYPSINVISEKSEVLSLNSSGSKPARESKMRGRVSCRR